MAIGTYNEGLTKLKNVTPPATVHLTVEEIWHRRLGHPSDKRLEKACHTSEGMPALSNVHINCTACSQGKQTRKPISKGPAEEPDNILEKVHSDLVGSISTPSIGGAKYIIAFVDAKTRHTWIDFLKTKDETSIAIDTWTSKMNNNTEETVKTLFTDNGSEFTGQATQKVLAKHGIIHETTTPNTPEYNSIVEKRLHLILQMARTILHQSGLPRKF